MKSSLNEPAKDGIVNQEAGGITIRHAERRDSDELLSMMIQLAEFEGYADGFRVTKSELDKRLFDAKDFCVLIAEVDGRISGMLVYYYLPFTYDLTPWVMIKELFVKGECRSRGVAKSLMAALAKNCVEQGSQKIRWDVLSSNIKAKRFYESLGAESSELWEFYSMGGKAIAALSSGEV